MNFKFPKDFLFGAACSACQIEAGCHEGGKGEDVGEHFYKLFPEKYHGADPDKAADFYHKYPQDIELMKDLGIKVFRFSISWSRIYPEGPDRVEQRGIDYYKDMMIRLKSAGIVTFFDLFHCDLPYWVIEKGGILNPEFIKWFTDYARTCFTEFGEYVDYWNTVNEPSINCFGAYAEATNAPFHKEMKEAIQACHNMILAHYKSVRIYKELGFSGKISAVIHIEPVYALSMDPKDQEAARRHQDFYSGWWLDPFMKGHYPERLLEYKWLRDMLPENYQKELDDNFIPCDYIGFNYYSPGYARYVDDGQLDFEKVFNEDLPKDPYGFYAYPQGLTDLLSYLSEMYPGVDLFVTENGIAAPRDEDPQKDRDDEYRVKYLREHLRAISRAIKAGAPVKGYFHWTIMDTNELYAGGYEYIFGLIQIDFNTLERHPRKSFEYYKKVIAASEVD